MVTGEGSVHGALGGEVRVVDFPETRVAVFMHRGDPALVGESVKRFRAWRMERGLSPDRSATFNILYGDPSAGSPVDFRLDLCAGLPDDEAGIGCGMLCRTIPAGRSAVLRHFGPDETLNESIRRLVAEWFPRSGERRRDYPLYLQRVRFFPEVPATEAVIDLFLPIV